MATGGTSSSHWWRHTAVFCGAANSGTPCINELRSQLRPKEKYCVQIHKKLLNFTYEKLYLILVTLIFSSYTVLQYVPSLDFYNAQFGHEHDVDGYISFGMKLTTISTATFSLREVPFSVQQINCNGFNSFTLHKFQFNWWFY